ncbi:MAG: hypothetical protein HYW48_07760 [Deltaproteobacteria bacterium]|nr:hypothetical protein [Deltaproteobacteria bacterium]
MDPAVKPRDDRGALFRLCHPATLSSRDSVIPPLDRPMTGGELFRLCHPAALSSRRLTRPMTGGELFRLCHPAALSSRRLTAR